MVAEELLSVSQAAERLGIRYGQVMRAIRSNKINAQKVGWNWVIPVNELEKLKGELNGPDSVS